MPGGLRWSPMRVSHSDIEVKMAPQFLAADGIEAFAAIIRERASLLERPFVVALDGRSGSGKSTIAEKLATSLPAVIFEGDDFFAGGTELRGDGPDERAKACIDWRRQRPVLEALRAGRPSLYFAFDWDAFDGRLEARTRAIEPCSVVVFEGTYTARPELGDLIDLRALVRVPDETRLARLQRREGHIGPWERQWHEAEDWYFANVAPLEGFDVVLG